jgi:PAS domain S-box-containing protein
MKLGPVRISVIYFIVSCLWITLSDKALFLFRGMLSPDAILVISSAKGLVFVIITCILLWQFIKSNNKRLSENDRQYRLMYEGSPLPKWIYDLDTLKFVSVNEAAIDWYGYSREQFLSMTILDIRPPEDKQKVIESIKTVSSNLKHSGTWTHYKANGTIIFVTITSQQITFNKKPHVIVNVQDVTDNINYEIELKKLNNDLNEQKRKLSETQQIAKIGGWEFYVENKHLVWSDEMYIITEVQPHPQLNLYDLYVQQIYPEDRSAMIDGMNTLLSTGKHLNVTHRISLLSGQIRYVRQMARLEYKHNVPYKVIGSTQDITELKQMEIERNKFLFSLEDTLNNINEGFYALDKDLRFTKINKKFELETGIISENIIGRKLEEVFPGIVKKVTYQQYQKVLTERVSVKFEAYWRHFNKWHEVEAYPTEDGIAVYFNDITEKKEKDLQLQKAVERYETVAKATQDVIYDYDIVNDNLTFHTDATELIKCFPYDIGNDIKWWRSLLHPEDIPAVLESQHKAITNLETNWRCEYRMLCDGEYRYVYSQGYYIYNDDRQAVRLIGAVKDIDDLKRVNEENKRLAGIITRINNMVVVMDTDHRINWVNKAFEDYTGYTYEEVKGNYPKEFLGDDRISKDTLQEVYDRKKRLETFAVDVKHYLKNGSIQWVNAEYTPLFDNCGKHTGYIAVHKNITERKEKEEKIYKQNKILQEISWLSSHEIRKPVASILGLAYLAKNADSVEKDEIVAMIETCAEELDVIVHTINDKISDELYMSKDSIEIQVLI